MSVLIQYPKLEACHLNYKTYFFIINAQKDR